MRSRPRRSSAPSGRCCEASGSMRERDREGETRRINPAPWGKASILCSPAHPSSSPLPARPRRRKASFSATPARSGSPAPAHAGRISCRASASTAWDRLPCLRIHARAADESPARRSTSAREPQDARRFVFVDDMPRSHAVNRVAEARLREDAGEGRGLKLMTVENRFDRANRASSASASLLTETNDR